VRNNSLYASGSGGALGIRLNTEGSGHRIVANALRYTGSGSWACIDVDLASAGYAIIDHQVCGFGAGSWELGSGSLAAWQASGFDSSSLAADPGFVAPAAPSWDLRAANALAAMVDRGDPVDGSPIDFFANPRPASPDVGAYEHGYDGPIELFADSFE
jgi:hypothetical protein